MDSVQLHLLLNHIPVLGTFFGFCLLVYGLTRKNNSLENAGLVTLVVVTLVTIPAFFSGEEAEETVEHLPNVSELYLEEHEELAEVALWLMLATGVLALGVFIISAIKNKRNTLLNTITVLITAGTLGVMIVVGNYGGKIRHSELREKTSVQTEENETQGEYEEEHDEEEEDHRN